VKFYIWSITFYGAETWTLWKIDQEYVESSEMWCWRRIEKISCTDHVRSEVLQVMPSWLSSKSVINCVIYKSFLMSRV
jgi:hypothetical protein